jgi:NAD(P)H-hydrate epimerase
VQLLNAEQIRAWDRFTMEHEPVSSIDLMERAAAKCVEWISGQRWLHHPFKIFCGKGNNGGDGLAIARRLIKSGYSVSVYILESGKLGSGDFQHNLQRLHDLLHADIHFLQSRAYFPLISTDDILIDALFGTGLNKAPDNLSAELVDHINHSKARVVSVDLPSGLFADQSSQGNKVVEADHTLTFQCYKTGLLVAENAAFIGEVTVLDIGLDPDFLHTINPAQQLITPVLARQIFKPRKAFEHKGNFGHALLIAGSYGKMGAAVLCAKACLRSGVGLLTCHLPHCGYQIMQTAVPEAMVIADAGEKQVAELPSEIENYAAIGIGPGIGTSVETQHLVSFVIRRFQKALVVDADGLNCISLQPGLLKQLPSHSIITPHPKEFDRLFGEHHSDFDRIATAREKAREHEILIVLKGHHTLIATPGGQQFFNTTGNAGMAKGGSGDVLTGVITALAAQQYPPEHAAVLGVYIHGLAGDLAAGALSQEAMTATDIIGFLSQAFLQVHST